MLHESLRVARGALDELSEGNGIEDYEYQRLFATSLAYSYTASMGRQVAYQCFVSVPHR